MLFKKPWIAVLFFVSIASAASENHERSFDQNVDSLCFLNKDPELAKADPLLGKLGVKKGVCQGIAGLSAAFFENVVFDPNSKTTLGTDKEVEDFIRALRVNYRTGSADKIKVGGFADLKSFCSAHRTVFLRQSARFNMEIGIRDILPLFPSFLSHKTKPIRSKHDQNRLKKFLTSVRETLSRGRLPLILVYSHVVLVQKIVDHAGSIDLIVYDSNHAEPRTWSIQLDPDGTPSLGNRMYWDITPDSQLY